MKSRLKENILYSTIYQILTVITPLITSPYLSRVLGVSSIGDYNYTLAYAYFFFLFAMLGVNNYGSRSIAQTKNDRLRMSTIFCEIYSLQLILSIIFSLSYYLFIFLFSPAELITLFCLQGLVVLAAGTDINWLAFGLERFKYTTIRNIIIKIITLISIFLFIKNSNDTWRYILITEIGIILGLLSLWPLVKKEVVFVKPKLRSIILHIKPNIILFLPLLAMSVFQYTDKIMLGNILGSDSVGFYSYAENILNVPLNIIIAICNVIMPRITVYLSSKKEKEANILFEQSLFITTILEIAMCFGIASCSNLFIPLYLGDNYIETAHLLIILSPIILLSGLASVIRMCLLIPKTKDKIYVISIILGALINIIGNVVLIPYLGTIGACISTISSYLVVLIVQIIFTRKDFNYPMFFIKTLPFLILGIIMYYLVQFVENIPVHNSWIILLIKVSVGFLFYSFGSVLIMHIYNKKKGSHL